MTASLQAPANVLIPARPYFCSHQGCQVPTLGSCEGWSGSDGWQRGAGGLAPTSQRSARSRCVHPPTSPPGSDSHFNQKHPAFPPSPPCAFSACAKTALFFWLVSRAHPGGKLAHAAGAKHLTELSAFLPALLLQLQGKTRSSRPPLLRSSHFPAGHETLCSEHRTTCPRAAEVGDSLSQPGDTHCLQGQPVPPRTQSALRRAAAKRPSPPPTPIPHAHTHIECIPRFVELESTCLFLLLIAVICPALIQPGSAPGSL